MQKHIGPYQRPAPPKTPLGLSAPKTAQKSAVPMHEIEAQAQVLLQGMIQKARKPGRPAVHQEPMTPAERQARRRAAQKRDQGIQEALRIGNAHGKSRVEAASGGWGKFELDRFSANIDEDIHGGHRVKPRPGSDGYKSHKVHVRGLQFGDEESNRRLFAENELKKMIGEHFESPTVNPSAQWIARYVSNNAVTQRDSQSLTLSCKACSDVMESMCDAEDHLREDHKELISEWFARLNPPREFRDMRSFVTVAVPRSRRKRLESGS
jgi:hypothetical protein